MTQTACDVCGALFMPARPWGRFCSVACRVAAHRRDQVSPLEASLVAALAAERAGRLAIGSPTWSSLVDALATRAAAAKPTTPLRDRLRAYLSNGHAAVTVAHAIGLRDGSSLSRFLRAGRDLPADRAARLVAYLDRQGA
jgi:hypothetical protein